MIFSCFTLRARSFIIRLTLSLYMVVLLGPRMLSLEFCGVKSGVIKSTLIAFRMLFNRYSYCFTSCASGSSAPISEGNKILGLTYGVTLVTMEEPCLFSVLASLSGRDLEASLITGV